MGLWRGPTLRSLIEVLDRVIGRGVVIDSDVPVSPALAGLRRAAATRESAEMAEPWDSATPPEATLPAELPAQPDTPMDEEVRDPPRWDGQRGD